MSYSIKFLYRSHRSEVAVREVGESVEIFPPNQKRKLYPDSFVLMAFDLGKNAWRDFKLDNILAFGDEPISAYQATQKRIEDLVFLVEKYEETVDNLESHIDKLEGAIRRHRDYRGDNRCHQDDGELYKVLPEGDTRPAKETAVTIENCQRFIECRQQGREYVSPQSRIEELERENADLKRVIAAS